MGIGAAERELTWEGGTIHWRQDGKPSYRIEKMLKGKRYKIALGVTDIHAARAHYDRFQRNPDGFSVQGVADDIRSPLYMTAELVERFLSYSREEKQNCKKWVGNQRTYLADWAVDLHGIPLSKVSLRDHVVPALSRRRTARKLRIEVVKAFYGWLRKSEHLLTTSQDPTMDLPVPQATPEKHTRRKVIPRTHVVAARKHVTPLVRDALDVTLETAWHGSEVRRFVESGYIVERPAGAHMEAWPKGVAAVLVVKQKKGREERWSVTASALKAAKRLKKRRTISERNVNRSIERACAIAKVPTWTYGPLRHTVLTWAKEAGATIAEIAEDLAHHKDQRTTREFYLDVNVPKRIPTR